MLCVLKCLDQRSRLQAAAFVCRAWRAAAMAASTQVTAVLPAPISNSLYGSYRERSLRQWLEAHSSRVHHLSIKTQSNSSSSSGSSSNGFVLPFVQLGQLLSCSFVGCSLPAQGLGNGSSSSMLAGLTRLTALQLDRASLPSLASLSALQCLRRLQLHDITAAGSNTSDPGDKALCLRQLTQLTSVSLQSLAIFPEGATAVFKTLQQLRQLEVLQPLPRSETTQQDELLAQLPPSLTKLKLQLQHPGRAIIDAFSGTDTPWLQGLTAMQHLQLAMEPSGGIVPTHLGSMRQLRVLVLQGMHRCALPVLARAMHYLRSLKIVQLHHTCKSLWVRGAPFGALHKYRELLPFGEHLREFSIRLPGSSPQQGCWQFMFFFKCRLPRLEQLTISVHDDGRQDASDWELCLGDLQHLIDCCPNLQQLRLREAMRYPAEDLPDLLQLTGLTALTLTSAPVKSEAAAWHLAKLTGLCHLRIEGPFSDGALRELTSLTGLTALEVVPGGAEGRPTLSATCQVVKRCSGCQEAAKAW
jgi:hypothetical protein